MSEKQNTERSQNLEKELIETFCSLLVERQELKLKLTGVKSKQEMLRSVFIKNDIGFPELKIPYIILYGQ